MILLSCLFATQITAQYSIIGNIKDAETQKNIPNVNIYISDLKKGISTDSNGNYQFSDLKKGHYTLEIQHSSYKSEIKEIDLNDSVELNFTLEESHKEISELVMTGVTRATEIKRNPVVFSVVDKNSLQQNNATNLIDALKNVPGINQISTGGAISKPVIRGLGYNRVITLFNGIRQEGQQWGDEHGIEIDELGVEKVEIIKGPGSLLYGSDGIAGVLNFLSPKNIAEGQINTQLTSNYQSNNQLISNSIVNSGNKNGWQWSARMSHKLAGNYENKYDGKVYNSGFRELNGSLFLGINRSWGYSHFHVNSYNSTMNLPEGERNQLGKFIYKNAQDEEVVATEKELNGYLIGMPHQKVNHLKLTSNNYFLLEKGSLNVDLAFQNNQRREFANPADRDEVELFFDLNTFNYNAVYNFKKINNWETSLGFGGMHQTNKNRGAEYLIPDYQLFDGGIFVFSQKRWNQFTLAGGVRYDFRNLNSKALYQDENEKFTEVYAENYSTKFNAIKKNFQGISGSLGLSYVLDKAQNLKLNLSRGYRAPNISELSSNGKHEGTFRYEIGNADLKPEISHQLDFGYYLDNQHITLEISPFINHISNFVFTKKMINADGSDYIPDPKDGAPAFEFTQGNALLLGGEVFLDIHPHPLDWLHFAQSFSFVEGTLANRPSDETNLPFMPAPKYTGEIKLDFKEVSKTFNNAYFKVGMNHYFQQNKIYSAYDTETATPSYSIWNIGLGTNVEAFKKKDFLQLFVNVDNLFDTAYQSHLSRLKYAPINPLTQRRGIYNMGRNVSVKLIFNF